MQFRYERVPRWIGFVTVTGTVISGLTTGLLGAAGFALGALGSWWNYQGLVDVVQALARAAVEQKASGTNRAVFRLMFRFFVVAAAILAILKYSRISVIALLVGLFTACIAIALELIYEVVWSTKSG